MKFLLAIDGSENSLRAAKYTADLIEYIPDSSATIVFVDNLMSLIINTIGGEAPLSFEHVIDDKVEEAVGKAQKILSERNAPYNTEILENDDIATAVSEYAENNDYDQIIMGTRGFGSVKGVMMGSVSHKVLQIAPCPVTLVK